MTERGLSERFRPTGCQHRTGVMVCVCVMAGFASARVLFLSKYASHNPPTRCHCCTTLACVFVLSPTLCVCAT